MITKNKQQQDTNALYRVNELCQKIDDKYTAQKMSDGLTDNILFLLSNLIFFSTLYLVFQ